MQEPAQLIRQSLLELPLLQRAVVVALRHIQQQIQNVANQQQEQISKSHLHYRSKFQSIEKEASRIIAGGAIKDNTQVDEKFFTSGEKEEKEKFIKSGFKLKNYWRTCIMNSELSPYLTASDISLLPFLELIQTSMTAEHLQLTLTFSQNTILKPFNKSIARRLKLENGMPASLEGDQVEWIDQSYLTQSGKSIIGQLLTDNKDLAALGKILEVMSLLINEVIGYSLDYYLGIGGEDSEDGLEDVQEDQEDDENGDPSGGQPEEEEK